MSNPNKTEDFDPYEFATIAQDHNILMGEALNRLRQNTDFQTLILDGYLKEKQLASFSLLAVPQEKQAGRRPDIFEDMIAGSNLAYFFKMVDNFYEGAKNPVLSDAEQDELETEGGTH